MTVRPGKVKGWAVHREQVDRYFFYQGTLRLMLYDDRPDSPTHRMVNELYFSVANRSLVLVPPHVYHAVPNVGTTDGSSWRAQTSVSSREGFVRRPSLGRRHGDRRDDPLRSHHHASVSAM